MIKPSKSSAASDLLRVAAYRGNALGCRRALRDGADPNARSEKDGHTALHDAAIAGQRDTVGFLLENGAHHGAVTPRGETPLHFAAWAGNAAAVQLLLEAGAEVDHVDSRGRTPLHKAVLSCNVQVLEQLLEKGAKPDVSDLYGSTPAEAAGFHLTEGDKPELVVKMAELLLRYGATRESVERLLDRAGPVRPQLESMVLKSLVEERGNGGGGAGL